MTALRRTETLGYTLAQCCTLDRLQQLVTANALDTVLLPPESAFAPYPRLQLDTKQAKLFQNGVKLDSARLQAPQGDGRLTVWLDDRFLGVAHINPLTRELVLDKLFALNLQ